MRDRATPGVSAACPDWQTLSDFHSGRLTDPERSAGVRAHVLACAACGDILTELGCVSTGLTARLAACLNDAGEIPRDNPGYRAMEAGAKAISPPVASGADTAPFVVRGPTGVGSSVGHRVGPYQIVDLIGQGGMGVVYQARHEVLDRVVALKMIRAGTYAPTETVLRFRAEGAAVARLRHPNIAHLYEFGEHDGLPYLTMEWVGGGTLAARLAGGPLAPSEAAEVARVLAAAMAYAHDRKVVHRDLKPGNVLIAEDGTFKVADFGLAKLLDEQHPGLTTANTLLGTLSYMAPEQAEGRTADTGPPTDVYALGAILYEMLTHRVPYPGTTKAEVLRQVLTGELVPPTAARPGIPRGLEAICLKCLARDPARRYPSARLLADDLARWLAGMPTAARPAGPLGRLARTARRRVGAACLVVAGGAAGTAALYPRPPLTPLALPEGADTDPDGVCQAFEADLQRGHPVTLIGDAGRPRWYKWRVGSQHSQVAVEDDGTFSVSTREMCLLELLPDPRTDRYRVSAQLRHDLSDYPGDVGVYVARVTYPQRPKDVYFFTQLSFNAVRSAPPGAVPLPQKRAADGATAVELFPRLCSDKTAIRNLDCGMPGAPGGPRLKALGERNGRWHDLDVTVTPDGITAVFGGRTMNLPHEKIQHAVGVGLDALRRVPENAPYLDGLAPAFAPRGGLGLILWRGSASVRRVSVSPLPAGG